MITTLIVVISVLSDQISKYYAADLLRDAGSVPFVPGVLSLRYHENSGAAWGILADHRWVFMSVSVVAILAIIGYMVYTRKEKKDVFLRLALPLFLGGGIGNMIDRVRFGYVVDFLEFDFIDFPIFNVADSCVTVAAVLVLIYLVRDLTREARQKKERHDNA